MEAEIKVIQPSGLLDSIQGSQIRQEVSALVQAGVKNFLIDLAEVTLMDSSGLGALVTALQQVKAMHGQFSLCSVGPRVQMVFELTGLDQAFEIYADRHEFEKIKAAKQESPIF